MTCPKHPRYRGLRRPRVLCRVCWQIFLGMCETCVNCGCQQNEVEEDTESMKLKWQRATLYRRPAFFAEFATGRYATIQWDIIALNFRLIVDCEDGDTRSLLGFYPSAVQAQQAAEAWVNR